jgi:hypothetical protein
MDVQQIVSTLIPVIKDVIAGSITMSDSGTIGGARELGAIATYLRDALTQFEGNTIIEGVVGGLFDVDGSVQMTDLDQLDVTNLFRSVGSAAALLDAIPGGGEIKGFIYGLAEKVAGAAGGGLFGGGQKVNAGEEQYLAGLRAQLGL